MERRSYKAKSGAIRYRPVLSESEFRAMDNDMTGWCLGCGGEVDCCEPDARCEDLEVQCTVLDAKVLNGQVILHVEPLSGRGQQWITLGRLVGR